MTTVADEFVQVQLGDDEIRIATQYEVRIGIFDQPSSFSLTLGSGLTSADIIKRYPPRTGFQLFVGSRPQFAGYTDGFKLSGSGSGATEVSIKGRDVLALAYDSFHEKESSYVAMSHIALVDKMLDELGLLKPFNGPDESVAHVQVKASNAETRDLRSGATIPDEAPSIEVELGKAMGTRGNAQIVLRSKLGERWMDLVERHLRQSGLFMWCSATGDAVIGRPNYHQTPIYKIIRKRGQKPRYDNVISFDYEIDFQPRYSEVVIYGKSTGRKYARTTQHGAYTDDELVSMGFHKVLVVRDAEVTSTEAAERMARRRLAEGRRRGFALTYIVAGHVTSDPTSVFAADVAPKCWAPDTMVHVEDDEIGVNENFWIEQVIFRRSATGTTTQLKLLPRDALIFGEDV
jgi:prophage tail gpP-like protein